MIGFLFVCVFGFGFYNQVNLLFVIRISVVVDYFLNRHWDVSTYSLIEVL